MMEKKQESLMMMGMAFVIGLLVGVLGTFIFTGDSSSPSRPASAPVAAAPQVNFDQQIQQLKGILAREPDNRNAWVQLGHAYFDSNQPVQAVEAYDKALALDGNDANVLTDQGVMFRQLGWYDRAIENFSKANQTDPKHLQSLFNLGIVYKYDLKDFDAAKQAWSKLLALNPPEPMASQVRSEIEFFETHPQIPTNK